MHRGRERER